MSCYETGVTILNDKDGRLAKVVDDLANGNNDHRIILAGYVNSQEFYEYCKTQDKIDFNKTLAEQNMNTIKSLLKKYFREHINSVLESASTRSNQKRFGFSSMNAKSLAVSYIANTIRNEYYKQLKKNNNKDKKINKNGIISFVIKSTEADYVQECVKPFCEILENDITIDKKTKDIISNLLNIIKTFEETNKIFNDTKNKLFVEKSPNAKVNLLNQYKALDRSLTDTFKQILTLSKTLINKKGNVAQKNYTNLIEQILTNKVEFFNSVFDSSKLVNLVEEFDKVLESDKFVNNSFSDDADYVNIDADTTDEMAKHWEDTQWSTFSKCCSADLKMYFDTICKMSSPSKKGETNYNYDRNNEAGVPITVGSNFIIHQLINFGAKTSVDDFIDSIYAISQNIPECYCLIDIVNRCNKDRLFANYLFTQMANEKISKLMVTSNNNGTRVINSNQAIDTLSGLVFDIQNYIKGTYTDMFNENYSHILDHYNKYIDKHIDELNNSNSEYYQKLVKDITKIFKSYYPAVNEDIVNRLFKYNNDIVKNVHNILDNLYNLNNRIEKLINDRSNIEAEYNVRYATYMKNKGSLFETDSPKLNFSSLDFSKLNMPIINIAKQLNKVMIFNNDLNSVNAEGNLSSDVIPSSWITNIIKQINYSTPTDEFAGLRRLLNKVTKGKQYLNNPLLFGVKDKNGNLIVKGLFIEKNGQYTINPDAKNLINISLFNGIKDTENNKSLLYTGMRKESYLQTMILSFLNPIRYTNLLGLDNVQLNKYAGYFMQTPSDAPKNFIVQTIKISTNGLVNYSYDELQNEYNNFYNKILNGNINFDLISSLENQKLKKEKQFAKNVLNKELIYNIINGTETKLSYNRLKFINGENNIIYIPILHEYELHGETFTTTFWVKANKVTDTICDNVEYLGISNMYNSIVKKTFLEDVKDIIKQDAINNNRITAQINRANSMFYTMRQHLYGELVTFIDQLNSIFKLNNETNEYELQESTTGLIDRYHYNKKIIEYNKKTKRYELTGNVFKFNKLFKLLNVDVNQMMINGLSLYGESNAVIIKKDGKFCINQSSPILNIKNNNIELVATNEVNSLIDDIVENWVNNCYIDTINQMKRFKTVNNTFNTNELFEFILNNINVNIALDDVFQGGNKFYKSSRDNFKRAKEVQGSGTSYAGFNLNDELDQDIHDIINSNGEIETIKIGDMTLGNFTELYLKKVNFDYKSNARNGFRGVTIKNTVRPSKYANQIRQESFNILKNRMSEEEATKKAFQIYKGFADNTKTNDAQSYITLEEFIRRRYADGTLELYKEILNEILEVRRGNKSVKDIDIINFNARIQVQKNFYFDNTYADNVKTHYPRQIKNAEFVLIPELLEGTDLKYLYDIMIKNDIGQVNTEETSKAAKRNVLTFWDNDGNINENFENEISSNPNIIENYYYRYLYKQQDVHDHMMDKENKAGLQVLKKIIDNTDPNNKELNEQINRFFKNYCANIQESFDRLIFSLGWKVNEDGSLSDIYGNDKLDFTEFYKLARRNAQRLGLDENFIEYLTPTVFGDPTMPNYMNNVNKKLESIAQSIFNNSITRQTFSGWHAAQVTQIGHGEKVLDSNSKLRELKYHPTTYKNKHDGTILSEEEYNKLSDNDKNLYEVKQEAYAEVLIPRWSKILPKDFTEANLEKEGLDLQIAYRIPTEGKQSISIVKVVGFLDDMYGSTVMLPDEWVTQTGSDFDVDSVYAIAPRLYKTTDGKVKKIKLDTDTSKQGIERRYKTFVFDRIGEKIDINDLYSDISAHKEKIKELKEQRNKISEDIKNYYNTRQMLMADMSITDKQNINKKLTNEYEELNKLYEEIINSIEKFAINAGLPTIDEFSQMDILMQNTKAARDNEVLDSMLNIMSDENSREENYSRSNFDDITEALDEIKELTGANDENSSIYNPFDQITFMDNAMSGADLKARSVMRDTFNSVSNRAKGVISNYITVSYDLTTKNKDGNNVYNVNTIIEAYGLYNEERKTGNVILLDKNSKRTNDKTKAVTAIVKHNKFAHSNTNRNVVGNLITVYSSETTAHILDAIKIGTIPNENEFTFGVFKTLIDLGIDYKTAIGFLVQPGITSIVNAVNESSSIYSETNYYNPAETAIKRLFKDIVPILNDKEVNEYTNMSNILNYLNKDVKFIDTIKKIFNLPKNTNLDFNNISIPISYNVLANRLKNKSLNEVETYENKVFDLTIALLFNNYKKISDNIEKIVKCSNPDKFGAKQTIKDTKQVLQNIMSYGYDVRNPLYYFMKSDISGTNILQSIYPLDNISDINSINIQNSVYPYLAAFLKYATNTSVAANSQLFLTESKIFDIITKLTEESINKIFNSEEDREFKQQIVNYTYSKIPILTNPITIDKLGFFVEDLERAKESEIETSQYWDEEMIRVYGYKETASTNLKIENVYDPNKDELKEFAKLTPVQKIIWIQTNYNGDKGIFSYLKASKINDYEYKSKGYSKQSIYFIEDVNNIEDVYRAFDNSFYNLSPIVRLATLDLIKYAFLVEGFKFKHNALSKIITNSSLYTDINEMGTNIITELKQNMNLYDGTLNAVTKNFIERFIRSHSELVKERKLPMPNPKGKEENVGNMFKNLATGDIVCIPLTESYIPLLNAINISTKDETKQYVKITTTINKKGQKKTVLYNIIFKPSGVYLIPLNLLEKNETSEISINPKNNMFKQKQYYMNIVDRLDNGEKYDDIKSLVNEKDYVIPTFNFTNKNSKGEINKFTDILNNGTEIDKALMNKFIEEIEPLLTTDVENKLNNMIVLENNALFNSLVSRGSAVLQKISTDHGDVFITLQRIKRPTYFNNIKSIEDIKPEDKVAYTKMIQSGHRLNSGFYKVSLYTEPKVVEEIHINQEIEDEISFPEMMATTSGIEGIYLKKEDDNTKFNSTTVEIINNLKLKSLNNEYALNVVSLLSRRKININKEEDLEFYRKDIYKTLSKYIDDYSEEINKKLHNFEIDVKVEDPEDPTKTILERKKFDLADNELYTVLQKHPEYVKQVMNILLEGITFGGSFGDLINFPVEGFDEDTKKYINNIINKINGIKKDKSIALGFDRFFNNYIANAASTNPNVRLGLISMRETFGDINWFENWIGDPAAIGHKEIQSIIGIVQNIINQAVMIDAPNAQQKFINAYEEILKESGEFDINKVITKEGQLVRPYNDKFMEDYKKVLNKFREIEELYGKDSINYYKAMLERDEWLVDNIEQPIQREYYIRKNLLLRSILNNAPKEYIEYMKMIKELWSDTRNVNELTSEEKRKRQELNNKISEFLFLLDEKDNVKENVNQLRSLKEYIKQKSELEHEYFDYNEDYEFQKTLKNKLNIIKAYDNSVEHRNETLNEKLLNQEYKEAYDWIKFNTIYDIDIKTKKIIYDAFATMKVKDNTDNPKINRLFIKDNAFDEYGNKDPRKLSKESLRIIKELTINKYNFDYDSNAGEAILIKDTPNNLPVFKDSFYRELRDESENAPGVNARRIAIIKEINEILYKVLDDNGRIHAKDIFEKLTDTEINNLILLYNELHGIKGKRKTKEQIKKYKEFLEFKTNDAAFNEELSWALTNIKGTNKFNIFLQIFCKTNEMGIIELDKNGNYMANDDLYGYIIPKDVANKDDILNNKYVDQERTKARDLIENNVDFIPTEYYYEALNEASRNGIFNEWFKENHVFNPYKHRFEPLKVWTTMRVNPNGSLKGKYKYNPTSNNTDKKLKDKYKNTKYVKNGNNYNTSTGKYNSNIKLSPKEEKMLKLLESTMNFFMEYNKNNSFIKNGFIPRKYKADTSLQHYAKEALGVIGLNFRDSSNDIYHNNIGYNYDNTIQNGMLQLLKSKGYKKYPDKRNKFASETNEEYAEYLKQYNKDVEEIRKYNLKLDNDVMNRDYKNVFAEAIGQQVLINSKNEAKYYMYMLLEELKQNDTYVLHNYSNKPIKNRKASYNEYDEYVKTKQKASIDAMEDYTRRIIFDQFKNRSKLNNVTELLRNVTSAKYMTVNIPGAVANVSTGFINIMMEVFANDSFGLKELNSAIGMYMQNVPFFLRDMFKETSDNFATALIKTFDIIDIDSLLYKSKEGLTDKAFKNANDLLYSLQTGGEHYMQNTVLFTILKSNKIFMDIDGNYICGSFEEYIWKREYDVFMEVIQKDDALIDDFKTFVRDIKNDKRELHQYDTFRKDLIEQFMRAYCDKDTIKEFITAKKKMRKEVKTEWANNKDVAIDQFALVNGRIKIKADSKMNIKMFTDLKNKTIAINKKIHGYYDKYSASRLEFKWYGGILMQYHKHIYPGIMKRFRTKGYYNETTKTVEIGSYTALYNFLATDFEGMSKRISDRKEKGELVALASIKEVVKAVIDTVTNISTNWNLMPQWEKNAAKRTLGDLYGFIATMLVAVGLYAITDDDDEKESNTIATAFYIADRCISEAQGLNPFGIGVEMTNLYTKPIAAVDNMIDLLKGTEFLIQYLTDEDYDPVYRTGRYAKENKGIVYLKKNIPIVRNISRLTNMSKNNDYYKMNEKYWNMKTAKAIADKIVPDEN